MIKQQNEIKRSLARLYDKYNHREFIAPDPLQFVYRYDRPADMEIVGLLSAVLAYGRVTQIERSLEGLLAHLGRHPYDWVCTFDHKKRRRLADFKHRFTTGSDIADLLELLCGLLRKWDSIEVFFGRGYSDSDDTVIPAQVEFCDGLTATYAANHGGCVSDGIKYLLASPSRGSACKRLNLFLRWMVRCDDVDTGLWQSIDKTKLIVPVDVHMARLCRILGFYEQKTVTLKSAMRITETLAAIDPADPVKYDFALSRVGIVEHCNGKLDTHCTECELLRFCSGQ